MGVFLKVLGGASLEGADGILTGPATQRHRIALLALLAASPPGTVSREKLMALLWPESDQEHGRKLLNQSVYELRRALGTEAILSAGDWLTLDGDILPSDLSAFERALVASDPEQAVEWYGGPFLDGFFLPRAPEFDHWADARRKRLEDEYTAALEALAEQAHSRGDLPGAVKRWKELAAQDPYDSRFALRLMEALAADGNPAGALKHAEAHAALLREEFRVPPPRDLDDLAERLQSESATGTPRHLPRRDRSGLVRRPSDRGPIHRHAGMARGSEPGKGAISRAWVRTVVPIGAGAFLLGALVLALWRPDARPPEAPGAPASEHGEPGDTSGTPTGLQTHSAAAHEFFLRGSDPALLRSASTAMQAVEHFRSALALDSTYAAAWAGLAHLSTRVSSDQETPEARTEWRALAEEAALRAAALDDSHAEAHALLGVIRLLAFDWSAAEAQLRQAISLDSSRARYREWLVGLHLWTGRPAEAIAEAKGALALDPLSPSARAELARALAAAGRCDEALDRLGELEGLEPPLLRTPAIAAHCHGQAGNWTRAIEALPSNPDGASQRLSLALQGHFLARAGQRDSTLEIRALLLNDQGVGAFPLAIVEAGLGDLDRTLEWIEQALRDGSLDGSSHHFTVLAIVLARFLGNPRAVALWDRLRLGRD
jgi:DNA-binding SARP family transcriptional activator/Flp pilus assembly protein TadD